MSTFFGACNFCSGIVPASKEHHGTLRCPPSVSWTGTPGNGSDFVSNPSRCCPLVRITCTLTRSPRRPTQSFFQRVMHYVINEVLVDTLANSKTFQRFAVRSNVRGLSISPFRGRSRSSSATCASIDGRRCARAPCAGLSPAQPCPAWSPSLPSALSPTLLFPLRRRTFRRFPRRAWIIRRELLINLGSFSGRCEKSSGIQARHRGVVDGASIDVTNELIKLMYV